MDHKDNLALSGKKLNRYAHLRVDFRSQKEKHEQCSCLFVWRGKILLQGDSTLWKSKYSDTPLSGEGDLIYLGAINGQEYCCITVPDWPLDPAQQAAPNGIFDQSIYTHPDFPEALGFVDFRNYLGVFPAHECELAAAALGISAWNESYKFCPRCGEALETRDTGWSKTCQGCGRAQFPRSDPVAITLVTDGDEVLVGRGKGWPEGLYSLLAGFVEPGETIEAAAAREVYEEAGVEVDEVQLLFSQPWPFPASLMVGCSARAVSRDICIDPNEIEEAIWISRARMLEVFAGRVEGVRAPREGSIAGHILKKWVADSLK